MAKAIGDIVIDIERCKGCELCIQACPESIMGLAEKINTKGYRYAILSGIGCNGCANCAIVCPEGIITVYRIIEKKAV
ncbi:MAG: 2-oxoglutarate ferredoxin oxidoreductase subunit delta [Bacteroidota bacterium]|nr:2-oxoglutarate ferredoxin oxidoreductase subunit delta [Bacteroidota bacterium]